MNREFLMLARDFDPESHSIGGWMMSEKLDGMRAFWDGGITTGEPASKVPWANTAKDFIRKEEVISTGLWSRYGKVIHAPELWTRNLPKIPLDGELYAGRGGFQTVTSIVKDIDPNINDWMGKIQYMVFGTPTYKSVFADGRINNPNFQKMFSGIYESFYEGDCEYGDDRHWHQDHINFRTEQFLLTKYCPPIQETCVVHNQIILPFGQDEALEVINRALEDVVKDGGEGLMLRRLESVWEPIRSKNILKVKKMKDSEATVIGYTTGKKTDKGSKLLGMMGALIVDWEGKRFELSGFTDEERHLSHVEGDNSEALKWAINSPGRELPGNMWATHFPRGTRITFKYRELTNDGIPKEARFFRKAT